jgi:transaldolase
MAAGEMGCHSVTISPAVLKELSERTWDPSAQPGAGVAKVPADETYSDARVLPARFGPLKAIDPLSPDQMAAVVDATKVDYLANGGKALDEAIAADPEAARRLKFALEMFTNAENLSKVKVEKVMEAA